MYSHGASAETFNSGIANVGISGADMTSSGTGSYISNGFFLGSAIGQSGDVC